MPLWYSVIYLLNILIRSYHTFIKIMYRLSVVLRFKIRLLIKLSENFSFYFCPIFVLVLVCCCLLVFDFVSNWPRGCRFIRN